MLVPAVDTKEKVIHWKTEKNELSWIRGSFLCFFQVQAINNAIMQCAKPCDEGLYLRYAEEFIVVLPPLFCHISGSIRHREMRYLVSSSSFPVSTCLQHSSSSAGLGALKRCIISSCFHPFAINHILKFQLHHPSQGLIPATL